MKCLRRKYQSRECKNGDLERIPVQMNRDALQILAFAHVLFGKPVPTFPGHALAGHNSSER
jgi:hypothetical protein